MKLCYIVSPPKSLLLGKVEVGPSGIRSLLVASPFADWSPDLPSLEPGIPTAFGLSLLVHALTKMERGWITC
jgi:hypothetical protein